MASILPVIPLSQWSSISKVSNLLTVHIYSCFYPCSWQGRLTYGGIHFEQLSSAEQQPSASSSLLFIIISTIPPCKSNSCKVSNVDHVHTEMRGRAFSAAAVLAAACVTHLHFSKQFLTPHLKKKNTLIFQNTARWTAAFRGHALALQVNKK
jgi:hypothetical protein